MAQVINGNQVQLNDGKVISAQKGGWYDGQQFWDGSLSNAGQINQNSNQQGAGQQVSREVVAQTNPNNVAYIEEQRRKQQQTQGSGSGIPGMPGGGGSAGNGMGVGYAAAPTLNLPELYQKLYETSGIQAVQDELAKEEKTYIEAKGKVNDNPFLSEATRMGRVAKVESLYGERTMSKRKDVEMKKADMETKLNLEMKQFDINSQASQQALSQFNTLLSMGALDEANGDDIASITRSTGIPSNMIQSAIKRANSGEPPQIVTSIGEDGAMNIISIDKNTGQVMNQQSIAGVGKVDGGGKGGSGSTASVKESGKLVSQFLNQSKNSYGHVSPEAWNKALNAYIDDGVGNVGDFVNNYKNYTDPSRGDFNQKYGFDKRQRK